MEDERQHFTAQPLRMGGWGDMDLDRLVEDATAMQPGPIQHALLQQIQAEAERRGGLHDQKPSEHIYHGIRAIDDVHDTRVLVDGQPLPMTELARRKSPSGYEWGYGGSGSAALAHSLLAHEYGSVEATRIPYQDFKWMVIATLDYPGWTLTSSQIRVAVAALKVPTITEAVRVSVADGVDGCTETTRTVTRPDPMC